MANKARRYHSAESLGVSTRALTSDLAKVTLTFTPDASSTYVYIWSCDVKGNDATADVRVTLKNNAGSTLSTTNYETADTADDFATLSGIAFETFGASPTSQNVTLNWSSETTALTSTIRNARVVAIKLTAADAFVQNTADASTTLATLQTATTLSFTPATTGNYLILGSAEFRSSSTSVGVNGQITYSGTGYSVARTNVNDTTNYMSGLMQASVGSLSNTPQSVTIQYSATTAGTTVNCRRARLVALRLDELTDSSITTDDTSTTTTSITYVNKATTGAISTISGLTYLAIGTASITNSSTSISVGHGLSVDGTYVSESFQEATAAGFLAQAHFGAFDVFTAGSSTTVNFDFDAETASATSGADDVTLSVLLLDPTELYWVDGTGTWDATTATKWALTSGGTGGAAAPKSGTNVFFDSASDSGAGFTVTIGTGAICKDLTASGLDQTMTLAGSAAWSIYGNLTVPATNFTQSYTGTVTFAGTGSQTITTNGKSFTAFTFDGVGGTRTLQDALTLTGAATLTNGTLALSTYTFTCLTFASNNANGRTIDFGTGKFVITSSSTATVWNTATITNLTIFAGDGTGDALVELTGGGATTKTISAGALPETVISGGNIYPSSISFSLLNTAGTVAFTASNTVRNLTIANNSFTLSNIAITIYGDLTINGTTPTLTAGTNTWTFAATSGTKTITTNGDVLDFPITFNGVGGTWALGSALSVGIATSRTVSLMNGTLDLNSYSLTLFGIFESSRTTVRRLQNTGGTTNAIILTLNTTTTIWNFVTITNLTTDGTILVQLTGGGATTKTIAAGPVAEANSISFRLSTTAGTVAFNNPSSIKNLTIDNNSFTLSNIAIIIYGDLTINGTTPTLTAGTNTWTFGATSGAKTITTSGKNLDFPITFNGVGGTWQLQDALSVGTATSRTFTLTNGTIDLNEFNLTLYGLFSSSNSNVRAIDFGSTSKIILTLPAITVWSSSTATNFESLGNSLVQLTATGSTSTLTFGTFSESGSLNVQLSCATTTTVILTGSIKNLTIDNFDITLNNGSGNRTIYGNLLISGTTPTIAAGSSVTTFAATSGTKTITTSGKNLDFPITFNGIGGTWQLQDALSVGTATSRTVTLTNGTLDINSYDLTLFGIFSSSNDTVRRIQNTGGLGKIILSLNIAATVWQLSNVTNITTDGNVIVRTTGGGDNTKLINAGTLSEADAISFEFFNSAGNIGFNVNVNTGVRNLTIGNNSFTFSNTPLIIYGNFIIEGTTPTFTAGSNVWTFAATSGTKTITTNSKTLDFPITFDGIGGTWSLQDALTMDSTRRITLTSGTFNLNDYTCTAAGGFNVAGFNSKVLAHGSSDLVISLAGATAFNATGGNLTSTGTGKINLTSASAKTFVGNGNSYATLNQGGSGDLTITGSNTFQNITNSVQPATVIFDSVSTHTFTEGFALSGTAGNLITIRSDITVANHTLSKSSGIIDVSFCSINRSIATGGATWNALTDNGNVDGGNNTGWIFTSLLLSTGSFLLLF
jgi:hypothetical protein